MQCTRHANKVAADLKGILSLHFPGAELFPFFSSFGQVACYLLEPLLHKPHLSGAELFGSLCLALLLLACPVPGLLLCHLHEQTVS